MKVNEFVDGFEKANDKEKYVKKHIINTYVPYAEKITECKRIVDVSMYRLDEKGVKHFVVDTPTRYMLFVVSCILKYTDIEIADDNALTVFDRLSESGSDGYIFSLIGKDFEMFKSVLEMVVDDVVEKERNIIDFINTKIESLGMVVDDGLKMYKDYIKEQNDY